MTSVDCASALFYSMMKLALDLPHGSPSKLFSCTGLLSAVLFLYNLLARLFSCSANFVSFGYFCSKKMMILFFLISDMVLIDNWAVKD